MDKIERDLILETYGGKINVEDLQVPLENIGMTPNSLKNHKGAKTFFEKTAEEAAAHHAKKTNPSLFKQMFGWLSGGDKKN